MKQIRVKSPFLDITASNKRREAGDILLVSEERAAYLVSGKLCEYVEDEQKKPEPKDEPKDEGTKKPAKSTTKKK